MALSREFYDPQSVDASFGGRSIQGFADGSMIEVAPAADDYDVKVGTKGNVGVARIYNPTREVKIRLLRTSISNDMLSAARRSGRTSDAKGFASTFSVRDASGTARVSGTAVIKKPPTQVFSNGIDAYEWILLVIVNEADEVIGGNSSFA